MFAPILPSPTIPSSIERSFVFRISEEKLSESVALHNAITPDQLVGGAVVSELRFILAVELRNDPLGQYFAEFYAPLVEGVNSPNGSLRKNIVFVKSN